MFQNKDLPKEVAKSYFDSFDTNHDGTLDVEEMVQYLKYVGVADDNIKPIMHIIDTDSDGKFSFDEFYNFVLEGRELCFKMDDNRILIVRKAYSFFKKYLNEEKNGVTKRTLYKMLKDCGYKEMKDLKRETGILFDHIDKDNTGHITLPEIIPYLKIRKISKQ
eukprot:GAHX01001099.1.p1 GENE.GAHX01001099.1~~GAHX01001099.1.p1  ORF type:complete len:163 (+),score=41.60 GAHX01001099.1:31-519(+)